MFMNAMHTTQLQTGLIQNFTQARDSAMAMPHQQLFMDGMDSRDEVRSLPSELASLYLFLCNRFFDGDDTKEHHHGDGPGSHD